MKAGELTRQGKDTAQKALADNPAPAQKIADAILAKGIEAAAVPAAG